MLDTTKLRFSEVKEEFEKTLNELSIALNYLKTTKSNLKNISDQLPANPNAKNVPDNIFSLRDEMCNLFGFENQDEEEGEETEPAVTKVIEGLAVAIQNAESKINQWDQSQQEKQLKDEIKNLKTSLASAKQDLASFDTTQKSLSNLWNNHYLPLLNSMVSTYDSILGFLQGSGSTFLNVNVDNLNNSMVSNLITSVSTGASSATKDILYTRLNDFYSRLRNPSQSIKDLYKQQVKSLLQDVNVDTLVTIAKNKNDPVLVEMMKDKADIEDVSALLGQHDIYSRAFFNKGKQIVVEQIKNIIDEAGIDELSDICSAINNSSVPVPNDVKNALKSKVEQIVQTTGTPAQLKELYDKFDNNIVNAVTPSVVKELFTKQVNHLVDVDLANNYQSGQAFDPKKLGRQLKTLKQKIQDYQVLDEEFAKIATKKFGETFNLILEEGQFTDIQQPGQDANAIVNAIDQLVRHLGTTAVQNRLYEDSLTKKANIFSNLNFVSNADKSRADKFKQEEQNYQQVIQNYDAIVKKSYNDLMQNVNNITGKTKTEIDMQLSVSVADSYDEVLQKSTDALNLIKADIAKITQNQTLLELFDGSIQVDDVDNLEKTTLQRLDMQLDGLIRDANAKIKQITDDFAEQIEDLEPIAPLKDLSDTSLQALKESLDNMKKAVQDYNKQQAEDLKKKEEEKEDGTKEIPDEIMNDPEVKAQKEVVTKLLNKKSISLSEKGAESFLKQVEALEKYNQLVAKKTIEKQKKDEEEKKKKEEKAKKKKEEKEKKKKEKERKAKEKEEKQKKQQAKNVDMANESLAKQEYQQKVDKLDQYKKDNPEPEVSLGYCFLAFIFGVFPLGIYLWSVHSEKQEYNEEIGKLNKEVKDAKDAYDAKHQENMQKYSAPNSTRIIKNASPEFNSQSRTKNALQKQ